MAWEDAKWVINKLTSVINSKSSGKDDAKIKVITTTEDWEGATVTLSGDGGTFEAQFVTVAPAAEFQATADFTVNYIGDYTLTCGNTSMVTHVKALGEIVNQIFEKYHLYGYKKSKADQNPATRCEYTDMAVGFTKLTRDLTTDTTNMGSWEDTFVFNAFRPLMLSWTGEVLYELDHDDQRYRIDGVTASDISNTSIEADFMLGIKPIWVKRWEDEDYEYEQVCDIKLDEDFDTPNIADDGITVLPEIYRHAVKPSLVNGKVRSICGQAPYNNAAGATEQANIEAKGAGWYFSDFGIEDLLRTVLTLFSLNTNVQSVYGYGHCDGGTAASSLLTTGGLKDKGAFSGGSGNTYMKALWCENLYGDRWDRVAGLLLINGVYYAKAHPPFNDTGNNYENLQLSISGTSGGYISKTKMTRYGMLPTVVSGSETTYECDGCWFNNSGVVFLLAGGSCNAGAPCGFARNVSYPFSIANWYIGPSLSYRKPVAA